MIHRNTLRPILVAAGFLAVAMVSGGEATAQCNGGGGGMRSGSTSTLASSSPYSQNLLASIAYSSGNLMTMQYQQQVLGTQRQIANILYQNSERQGLAAIERETQARPYRLARAEANRAARAERIAARLSDQGRSADAYMLTSVNVD